MSSSDSGTRGGTEGRLFIVSSPSGGGKGTLIRSVLKQLPELGFSVSYTTREMREGEQDGKDYFFVGKERFRELIESNEFLEYADVHGQFYGTSAAQVKNETSRGHDIVLEIDVQGARIVREKVLDAVSVFILPPSFAVLEARLRDRGTDDQEEIETRLRNARREVKSVYEFEYVVINGQLELAVEQLRAIFVAERQKRARQEVQIESILRSFET